MRNSKDYFHCFTCVCNVYNMSFGSIFRLFPFSIRQSIQYKQLTFLINFLVWCRCVLCHLLTTKLIEIKKNQRPCKLSIGKITLNEFALLLIYDWIWKLSKGKYIKLSMWNERIEMDLMFIFLMWKFNNCYYTV